MVDTSLGPSLGSSLGPVHAPLPTATLDGTSLPIITWPARNALVRVHPAGYDPVYLLPREPSQRYDDPDRQFGTMYCAVEVQAAILETLLRNPRLRGVSRAEVAVRRVSRVMPRRDLRLVDFVGAGLQILGTDSGVNTGPYAVSRAWARALFAHPDCPDGIIYPSRFDPSLYCVAVFARPDVEWDRSNAAAVSDDVLLPILSKYGKGLL